MATTTNWRLADPEYVEFDPKTVQEAIVKFRRLQNQGLPPWMYPEAMIKCCAKLADAEIGKFEEWLVCPQGEPPADAVDVRDFLKAQAQLENTIEEGDEKGDDEKQEEIKPPSPVPVPVLATL